MRRAKQHVRPPCPAMDGRRPRGTMFARSGADPAWPVGGADMSEPQDAASESTRKVRAMALVGRRPGRRRRRWLALGVVLTIAVLAVDAAVSSRSEGPARQQATLAYLDTIRPLVERSTQQGADLNDVRANAIGLGRDGIGRRLERVSRESNGVLGEARKLDPPTSLRQANELLLATFAIRAKAADTMRL